jgi:hypothetical protein
MYTFLIQYWIILGAVHKALPDANIW